MNLKNKYTKDESDKIFFTSDTHFGHKAIIKLCDRPYSSVEEMNQKLIDNWNSVVDDDCIVFHLGDFAFGGTPLWNDIVSKLNGTIVLIEGNHDFKNLRTGGYKLFEAVLQQAHIYIEDRCVYLNHYPFLCYGGSWKEPDEAVWQLFGHIHSGPNSTSKDTNRLIHMFPYQYDVGVDNNNYTPVSWNQIKEIIKNQVENYG